MKKLDVCYLARCQKPLRGRQRKYCSRSHSVLSSNKRRNEQKEKRARENQLIRRMDSLTPQGRRALFLSVAYAIPGLTR